MSGSMIALVGEAQVCLVQVRLVSETGKLRSFYGPCRVCLCFFMCLFVSTRLDRYYYMYSCGVVGSCEPHPSILHLIFSCLGVEGRTKVVTNTYSACNLGYQANNVRYRSHKPLYDYI